MTKRRIVRGVLLCASLFFVFTVGGQEPQSINRSSEWRVVREHEQKCFPKTVPPGNYSGLTHLHDDIYAVVSDKSDSALYFNFRIQVNPQTGELENVENLGFTQMVHGGDSTMKP